MYSLSFTESPGISVQDSSHVLEYEEKLRSHRCGID